MTPIFKIFVGIAPSNDELAKSIVNGNCFQEMLATDIADQEINAKRMADQLISELFQRYRNKQ